ncbi:MAG: VWA domain-containing protein [Treponema sp.]|nr:VWA domain-containing protein [Treponema sp.]
MKNKLNGFMFLALILSVLAGALTLTCDNPAGSTARTYTVEYNANGGEGEMRASVFNTGELCELPANGFSNDGYFFSGWALASGGSVAYANKAEVIDLADVRGKITLYAVWLVNQGITWPTELTASPGQKLSEIGLPGNGTSTIAGVFTWTNPDATVGSEGVRTHNMTFTPADTVNYSTLTQNVQVTVSSSLTDYFIAWPVGITAYYGQRLSEVYLFNMGYSTIPGTFSWTTPTNYVGAVGMQSHNMTFTPNDRTRYETRTGNVSIIVRPVNKIENGSIRRFGAVPGVFTIDSDFSSPLEGGEVRLSQQVIADNNDGTFNVELKVQAGSSVPAAGGAIVFLIDESGSVSQAQFAAQKAVFISMINSFPSDLDIYFGVVLYSSTARIIRALTNNRTLAISSINGMNMAGGGTNLSPGLNTAQAVLSAYTGNGEKYVIVSTDGPPGDQSAAMNSAQALKNTGALIYVAGYNSAGAGSSGNLYNQIASGPGMFKYITGFDQLSFAGIVFQNDSSIAADIDQRSWQSVSIKTGSNIEFTGVVSNEGGRYTYDADTGMFYWNPKTSALQNYTSPASLVYTIRVKTTAYNQGFVPVSDSAVFRYKLNNVLRNEEFDIPKVRWW